MSPPPAPLPLAGVTVLDVTRMLPGAVLVRSLVDLGARVVKLEDPAAGDPMRSLPPLVGGVSAAFCAFFRGVESVALDLRAPGATAALSRLARHADVLVESFRPGTLGRWGLPLDRLRERCPSLVTVSLSSFGPEEPWASFPGHDLNFTAASGLLSELTAAGVPRVQLADVTTGLLALSGILGALLVRERTGRGLHVEQPLAKAPLAFLTWGLADVSGGMSPVLDTLLAGKTPTYRTYRCGDGKEVALGAIEPKFWVELVAALGMPELSGDGLDAGERGQAAVGRVAEALASRPREAWLTLAAERGIPLTAVRPLDEVPGAPYYRDLFEETPCPGGERLATPAPVVGGWRRASHAPAPALGEGTARVLREAGLSDEEIRALAP